MSITIQMVLHVFRQGGALDIQSLRELYPFENIIKQKITYAVDAGVIREKKNGERKFYINSHFGDQLGCIFLFIKNFLRWGEGG